MRAEYERLATVDSLTGATSRQAVMEKLDVEVLRHSRTGRPMSVMLLDIDYFKRINDQFGHAVGDRTLEQFARTVSACLRNGDALGRIGGEEFLVLLPAIRTRR